MTDRAVTLRISCTGSLLACRNGAYAGNGHQSAGQHIALACAPIWLCTNPAINSAR